MTELPRSVRSPFSESLSAAQLLRVDSICQRFEAAWKLGRRPALEEFLAEAGADERTAVLRELIWLDLHYRGAVPISEYEARFPNDSAVLRSVFAERESEKPRLATTGALGPNPDRTTDETHGRSDTGGDRDPASTDTEGVAVPGFELLSELGRGGMGVVYQARQVKLNRLVALKMVLGAGGGRKELIRFLAEAEAVAAVRHANVVQVYEYGEAAGRPYMALEFLAGGTLADRLKRHGRIEPREAAAQVARIAAGVAAAHAQGIVHRDLKPGNVLFDAAGEPKVADFGLAKRAVGEDLTQTGAIMGTPAYMAPEQAGGGSKFVGPQADVWALGVILHECLSGRRPFRAERGDELLARILTSDPEPLTTGSTRPPRDVELICSKCLEKSPADRYPTARELADDLTRFAAGEVISIRAAGLAERTYKWAKRKPTVAGLYAAAVVGAVLVAVATGSVLLAREFSQRKDAAEVAEREAERQRKDAVTAREGEKAQRVIAEGANDQLKQQNAELARLKGVEEKLREIAVKEKGVAEFQEARALKLERQIAFLHYVDSMDLAHREYLADDFFKARRHLNDCPPEFRHWEWARVHRLCHPNLVTMSGHVGLITHADISPDGRRVLTLGQDKSIRVWDADSGRQLVLITDKANFFTSASFSVDGRRVMVTSSEPFARILDAETWKTVQVLEGHKIFPVLGALSADGKRAVTVASDYEVRLWDVGSGKTVSTFAGHMGQVVTAVFSKDSARYLTASHDKTARVWDAATGKQIALLEGHEELIFDAAFSPDGKTVVTGSRDRTARVWDAATGAERHVFKSGAFTEISRVAFSHDGTRIATASNVLATLWEAESGNPLHTLSSRTGYVTSLSFSPDDKRLVMGVADRTARVWDVVAGTEIGVLKGHTESVAKALFFPDGKRVLTASFDGTARVWDVEPVADPVVFSGHTAPISNVSFSADRKRAVSFARDNTARVWNLEAGKPVAVLRGHTAEVVTASISADGTRVVTGSSDRTARVWDADTGRLLHVLGPLENMARPAVVSPDGKRVFATGGIRPRFWNTESGQPLPIDPGQITGITGAAFSDDGKRLAVVIRSTIQIWDAESGKVLAQMDGQTGRVESLTFSRDGTRLATASGDGTLRVWDTRTGAQLALMIGHQSRVESAAFSPDGKRVLSYDLFDSLRLWDTETGKLVFRAPKPERHLFGFGFSDDGARVITAQATGPNNESFLIKVLDTAPVNQAFIPLPPAPPRASKP